MRLKIKHLGKNALPGLVQGLQRAQDDFGYPRPSEALIVQNRAGFASRFLDFDPFPGVSTTVWGTLLW